MVDSAGAAERVAGLLRDEINAGRLQPGERLSEERVRAAHGVSRSSLREAFRLLIQEKLLVHELSRGVFVRKLTRQELQDIYRVRRIVETAAVRSIQALLPSGLRRLSRAVEDGATAAEQEDWEQVAAASIEFHRSLVALAGSSRLDALMAGVLAEHRLAYIYMRDTQVFHRSFLKRHLAIADEVRSGNLDTAAELLDQYLLDSEQAVLVDYID